MTLLDLLLLLAVAGIIGAIAQALAGYSHGGCLASVAVGFVGGVLGAWLARKTGLPELFVVTVGGTSFPIVWSVIGASLFVAVIGFMSRSRPRAG